jgi:hypothetical protein
VKRDALGAAIGETARPTGAALNAGARLGVVNLSAVIAFVIYPLTAADSELQERS